MITVRLSCGHTGPGNAAFRVGDWVSCWALMHPARGCQAQRKVIRVTGWHQGGLW